MFSDFSFLEIVVFNMNIFVLRFERIIFVFVSRFRPDLLAGPRDDKVQPLRQDETRGRRPLLRHAGQQRATLRQSSLHEAAPTPRHTPVPAAAPSAVLQPRRGTGALQPCRRLLGQRRTSKQQQQQQQQQQQLSTPIQHQRAAHFRPTRRWTRAAATVQHRRRTAAAVAHFPVAHQRSGTALSGDRFELSRGHRPPAAAVGRQRRRATPLRRGGYSNAAECAGRVGEPFRRNAECQTAAVWWSPERSANAVVE